MHYANYKGRWIKTRGPLSIPRSPQGHPVIMQAGASDRGRDFAARWAEMIFTMPARQGRDAGVLCRHQDAHGEARPAAGGMRHAALVSVVLGETESIARERAAYLDSLIDPELNRAATSSNLGADITKYKEGVTLAACRAIRA